MYPILHKKSRGQKKDKKVHQFSLLLTQKERGLPWNHKSVFFLSHCFIFHSLSFRNCSWKLTYINFYTCSWFVLSCPPRYDEACWRKYLSALFSVQERISWGVRNLWNSEFIYVKPATFLMEKMGNFLLTTVAMPVFHKLYCLFSRIFHRKNIF